MNNFKELEGEGEAQSCAPQPAREANIEAICAYIAAGCKSGEGALGIELEQHIVNAQDLSAVPYDAPHGSRWIIEQATGKDSGAAGGFTELMHTPSGDVIGAAREGATLTLEPAAQLEISAGPFFTLDEAAAQLTGFERDLSEVLAAVGERAVPVGYHPTAVATTLTLIPKVRYSFMNRYLSELGPYGPRMMRGSASTQISIDFSDEADCVRKMRLANLCGPLFALICDNTPIFEGAPRTEHLARTRIWRELDKDRCGVAPGSAQANYSWRAYAEWILDTPAIVAPGDDSCVEHCKDVPCGHVCPEAARAAALPHVTEENGWHYDTRTFGELYAVEPMTQADVEHALSMVFPDVRLKRYLEIRPADAMPAEYAVAYAALVKGLFYSEENLAFMETLFAGMNDADVEDAKDALAQSGWDAQVYGRPVAALVDTLFQKASTALGQEASYLAPLSQLAAQRKSPVDAGVVKL